MSTTSPHGFHTASRPPTPAPARTPGPAAQTNPTPCPELSGSVHHPPSPRRPDLTGNDRIRPEMSDVVRPPAPGKNEPTATLTPPPPPSLNHPALPPRHL